MKAELPPTTKAQLDEILRKVLGLLETARDHTSARSEFMNYDGSMGGQVLSSSPPIDHPYKELSDLYVALFERAKQDKLELREIETLFERTNASEPWTHRTRWLEAAKFKAFKKKTAPISQEIGETLRKLGASTAADWRSATFDFGPEKTRTLVLHGKKVRAAQEPTSELIQQAHRVAEDAREDGLELTGANWRVQADGEEDASDVEAALGVMPAWPSAK
jgi:hypothetical protein